MTRADLTVVVPAGDSLGMRSTIDSIVAAEMGIVSAVIVTGEAKTREAAESLGLQVVESAPGYAAALNTGLSLVKTRYAVIIAPGAQLVTPFGFSELARVSEDTGDSGLLLPVLTGDVRGRDFYRPGAPWETANIRPRDFMLVAGLLPMEVFGTVGPFDESFAGKIYADLDYAVRAIAAGIKIRLYQRVIVNNPRVFPAVMDPQDNDHARFVETHRVDMLKYGIR